MIQATSNNNKDKKQPPKTADTIPPPEAKARPVEVVSLDMGEEGEEPAVLSAETTRDLLQDAQEERYEKEVARHTDDEQIEDSLAQRQQLNHQNSPLQEKLENYHAPSPDLSAGDVDAAWDQANVAGEETVGGTVATPDQDSVDAIGEAVGITYEDGEPLQTADKLAQRDEERWELNIDSTKGRPRQQPGPRKEGEIMKRYKYVILGGGLAAGYAAQAFVESYTPPGKLCILSAESKLPYERPPLSKDFLAGEKNGDDILINEPAFYQENKIEVRLNSPVQRVDLQQKQLHTESDTIGFEKLLIATGARPRHLDVPGASLDNIFYLRQVGEARQIRQAAAHSEQAVVIGGSFIGMEVTSVLQSAGVNTTMVFPEAHVWEAFFTPEMAAFFEKYYRDRGVTILPQVEVVGFEGKDGRLQQVVLNNDTRLPADMVVAGIGVEPNIELFADNGLQFIDDGIAVNRFLETNLPDVYAAGDVACYNDVIFDQPRRVEHWDNAMSQGQHAIKNMMGPREPFVHVPYFFSDVFDLSYEFWGDAADAQQIVHRGDVDNGRFSVWWLGEEGRLQAAFVMDRPDEERELAPAWIRQGKKLPAAQLADVNQPLATMNQPLPIPE